MNKKWVRNKEFGTRGFVASFSTLFEDARDQMSDCVRPCWEVSERRENRLVEIRDSFNMATLLRKVCSKEEGNAIYRKLVALCRAGADADEIRHWIAEVRA